MNFFLSGIWWSLTRRCNKIYKKMGKTIPWKWHLCFKLAAKTWFCGRKNWRCQFKRYKFHPKDLLIQRNILYNLFFLEINIAAIQNYLNHELFLPTPWCTWWSKDIPSWNILHIYVHCLLTLVPLKLIWNMATNRTLFGCPSY